MDTPPDPRDVYAGPLKTFEQWTDDVERYWLKSLKRHVNDETARAGMRVANPMFMYAASAAYEEYVAGWQRRMNDRIKSQAKKRTAERSTA